MFINQQSKFYPYEKTIYVSNPTWGNHTPIFRCVFYLSICIYLSIYSSICPSIHLSISVHTHNIYIYISIYLSIIYIYIYISICPSILLYIHLCIHPSIHLSIHLSICPSIYLTIRVFDKF